MPDSSAAGPGAPVWRAPVRYAEVDQQNIAFNAHYLTWCDEAMGAFCAQRGLLTLAERVHLATTTLDWHASARWGDDVEVTARCTRLGTSSFDMQFVVSAAGRACCTVHTVYVYAIDGAAQPLDDAAREALTRP